MVHPVVVPDGFGAECQLAARAVERGLDSLPDFDLAPTWSSVGCGPGSPDPISEDMVNGTRAETDHGVLRYLEVRRTLSGSSSTSHRWGTRNVP